MKNIRHVLLDFMMSMTCVAVIFSVACGSNDETPSGPQIRADESTSEAVPNNDSPPMKEVGGSEDVGLADAAVEDFYSANPDISEKAEEPQAPRDWIEKLPITVREKALDGEFVWYTKGGKLIFGILDENRKFYTWDGAPNYRDIDPNQFWYPIIGDEKRSRFPVTRDAKGNVVDPRKTE